jgi:hypothetical protein
MGGDGEEWLASCPCRLPHGASWYLLDRRLGGPLYQSGSCGEEKNVCHC